jgi:hypothetical protein
MLLTLVMAATSVALSAKAGDALGREYRIKAAFVYNFVKFIDWPEEKMADTNEPIVIGIIGSRDFIKAFDPVRHKKIKNRRISIKYFEGYEKLRKSPTGDNSQWNQRMTILKNCHVLLLCSSDDARIDNLRQIIGELKVSPVLTVGETRGFLESGGIVNFLVEDKKVRFEINAAAAKKSELRVSSKLLRLAKRVIKEQ